MGRDSTSLFYIKSLPCIQPICRHNDSRSVKHQVYFNTWTAVCVESPITSRATTAADLTDLAHFKRLFLALAPWFVFSFHQGKVKVKTYFLFLLFFSTASVLFTEEFGQTGLTAINNGYKVPVRCSNAIILVTSVLGSNVRHEKTLCASYTCN